MFTSRNLAFATALLLGAAFAAAPHAAFAFGSTPVTVTNPADIAKAEGIQHPFHDDIACLSTDTVNTACNATKVAPNQQMIIEFVSGLCTIPAAVGLASLALATVVDGKIISQNIPILDHLGISDGTVNFISFGGPVRIYADPSTLMTATGFGVGTPNAGNPTGFSCELEISGQLIDVP